MIINQVAHKHTMHTGFLWKPHVCVLAWLVPCSF